MNGRGGGFGFILSVCSLSKNALKHTLSRQVTFGKEKP